MKLAIVGSRTITDYSKLVEVMNMITSEYKITQIVSGGAKGVDSLAERWAKENGIEVRIFPADWDTHGRAAGILRNEDIVRASNMVIALWDGKSRGTQSTIEMARKANKLKEVILIE